MTFSTLFKQLLENMLSIDLDSRPTLKEISLLNFFNNGVIDNSQEENMKNINLEKLKEEFIRRSDIPDNK